LAAGTYVIEVSAPAYRVGSHKCRLQNVTDATTVDIGQTSYENITNADGGNSILFAQFTIAASKAFEIQHYVANTQASNGYGVAMSIGVVEVYTIVKIEKIS
jgi:hypothetical protein